MNRLVRLARRRAPEWLKNWRRRQVVDAQRRVNASKPASAVFEEIYSTGGWGKGEDGFYSGSGSEPEMTHQYVELVKKFIESNQVQTVLDLGCGDFQVGRQLVSNHFEYIGTDIVQRLIERNKRLFETERVRFFCVDAISEPLPRADLCLVRQVLQHLSNEQIETILKKLKQFRYVIVTEHYPANLSAAARNMDKPHGPDTRIIDNSAVFLNAKPFDCYETVELLAEKAVTPIVSKGETIRSYLLQPNST